jgi:hypothetical protein
MEHKKKKARKEDEVVIYWFLHAFAVCARLLWVT